VDSRFFRDHHRLTHEDWHICIESAHQCGAEAIIITEKDAIKVFEPPDFPLLVAVQSTFISESGEFERTLQNAIRDAR